MKVIFKNDIRTGTKNYDKGKEYDITENEMDLYYRFCDVVEMMENNLDISEIVKRIHG
jgi:hypothetical protein